MIDKHCYIMHVITAYNWMSALSSDLDKVEGATTERKRRRRKRFCFLIMFLCEYLPLILFTCFLYGSTWQGQKPQLISSLHSSRLVNLHWLLIRLKYSVKKCFLLNSVHVYVLRYFIPGHLSYASSYMSVLRSYAIVISIKKERKYSQHFSQQVLIYFSLGLNVEITGVPPLIERYLFCVVLKGSCTETPR